jgi:hypothetical protein
MTGASEGEIMFVLGCVVAIVFFALMALLHPGDD